MYSQKNLAIFACGLVTLFGLMKERHESTDVDFFTDQMRQKAQERQTNLITLLGPPWLTIHRPRFDMLKKFAGTPYIVQHLPYPRFNAAESQFSSFDSRLRASEESAFGAGSFQMLKAVGWSMKESPDQYQYPWVPDGIHILSRRPYPFDSGRSLSPFDMPTDTPEERAWAAGEALTQYLEDEHVGSVAHFPNFSRSENGEAKRFHVRESKVAGEWRSDNRGRKKP